MIYHTFLYLLGSLLGSLLGFTLSLCSVGSLFDSAFKGQRRIGRIMHFNLQNIVVMCYQATNGAKELDDKVPERSSFAVSCERADVSWERIGRLGGETFCLAASAMTLKTIGMRPTVHIPRGA